MACNASGALTGGPSRLLIAPQSVDTIASWIHPEKRKRRRRITLQLFGSVRCPEPVLVIAQRFRSKLPPPQQPQLSSSYRCPAETRLFFECSFHMFVPSLSWSSNHFGRKRRVFAHQARSSPFSRALFAQEGWPFSYVRKPPKGLFKRTPPFCSNFPYASCPEPVLAYDHRHT